MGISHISDEELKQLYATTTLRKLAKSLHVTDATIKKRLAACGVALRSRGPERTFDPPREELEALYQQMSMRDISAKYGVGETVVWKRLMEHGIKLRDWEVGGHRRKTGRRFSEEACRNISAALVKRWAKNPESHPSWKGGVHEEHMKLRRSGAYKRWKQEALKLRGFQCQECGREQDYECECCGTKTRLHVHHVLSFAKHPESRFDPSNSEVLCPKCHHRRHHGKPGELRETPNVETRAILSQAAAGNGAAEGATTRL